LSVGDSGKLRNIMRVKAHVFDQNAKGVERPGEPLDPDPRLEW